MRVLYHLARADFLERVRRYNFLITLAGMIYFAYICIPPNYHRYVTMAMNGHRPFYNSAFTASLAAMLTSIFLSLAGFYLVKNAIDRDLRTGVGQILAATRMSTPAYMAGKALSNFVVLAALVAVMPVLAGVMQMIRGEDTTIQLWQLLAPFLFIALPMMAVVAGIAVLFEAIPFLRAGMGNVVYFFLWVTSLAMFASHSDSRLYKSGNDLIGVAAIIPGIRAGCEAAFPGCGAGKDFNLGFNFKEHGVWTLTNFRWEGVHWTAPLLLWRLVVTAIGLGLGLLAATFFSRFDPATSAYHRRAKNAPRDEAGSASPAMAHASFARLAPASVKFNFLSMVLAELRLALQGLSRWWHAVALGLIIGEAASPLSISRYWLIAAWIWPLLIWSAMGTREARQGTAQLVFSTAHPLWRQLPACWMAGVVVSLATGSGTLLRLLVAADRSGLLAFVIGALFVPTVALTLGVWTGSSKLFEIFYLLLWYVGPVNQVPALDYMGASGLAVSSAAMLAFLTATLVLAVFAVLGRKRQIQI